MEKSDLKKILSRSIESLWGKKSTKNNNKQTKPNKQIKKKNHHTHIHTQKTSFKLMKQMNNMKGIGWEEDKQGKGKKMRKNGKYFN